MERWIEMDGVQTDVYFFKHEGYLGALGALLENIDSDAPS
jgi:pantothenate kinase